MNIVASSKPQPMWVSNPCWIHIIAKSVFGYGMNPAHHCQVLDCQCMDPYHCQVNLWLWYESSVTLPWINLAMMAIYGTTSLPSQFFSAQNKTLYPVVAKAVTRNHFLTFSRSDPFYLGAIVNIHGASAVLPGQSFSAVPPILNHLFS